jgi:crotonyl-CoA reductase
MRLKKILSSHFANYAEASAMNRLIDQGKIQPILSKTFTLANTGEAANQVHHNLHEGKLGILCLAPEAGEGITNLEKRESIGENKITLFSRHAEAIEIKN